MSRGGLRWIGAQVVLVAIAVACGHAGGTAVTVIQTGGTLPLASGGASSGGVPFVDDISVGGSTAFSSGGTGPVVFHDCGRLLISVDPPCSNQDVLAPATCRFDGIVSFAFVFKKPSGSSGPFSLALLPLNGGKSGQGGEGGLPEAMGDPLALGVAVYPPEAGSAHGSGFDLVSPEATLTGEMSAAWLTARPAYLESVASPSEEPYATLYVAQLAVMSGTLPVWEQRIIIEEPQECILE
jgi:hypothetical protein